MALVHKAKPLSGSTSFVMKCSGYGSETVNLERKGETVKLTGAGGNAGNKTLKVRIYGTSKDNTVPNHTGEVTTLEEVTITTTMPKTEVNVGRYDRFIIYCVPLPIKNPPLAQ